MSIICRKLLVAFVATILLSFKPILMAEPKPVKEQKPVVDEQKSTSNQQDNQANKSAKHQEKPKQINIIKTIKELVSKR